MRFYPCAGWALGGLWLLATGCANDRADQTQDESDGVGIGTSLGADGVDGDGNEDAESGSANDYGDSSSELCEAPCGDDCCPPNHACDLDKLACVVDCGDAQPCGLDSGQCCGAGDICYVGQCVTPGASCKPSTCATETESECEPTELCDTELDRCVPNLADPSCTFAPEPGVFDPVPRWSWGVRQLRECTSDLDCQTAEVCSMNYCRVTWPHYSPPPSEHGISHQAVAAPMVADLDHDCVPEIVFSTFQDSKWAEGGIVRALHGDTGQPLWTFAKIGWRVDATATPAIGDLDADGDLEIVTVGADHRIQLIDHQGHPLWRAANPTDPEVISGAPIIANIDGQGDAEIVFGRTVYASDGTRVWTGKGGSGANKGDGSLSCVADLDGDSRPELIAGGTVYSFTGHVGAGFHGGVLWDSGPDGYCGVADFELDGTPEVVVVRLGSIDVLNGQTGLLLASFAIPGGGKGGAPNIADFDGDGLPDIGVAGGTHYVVVRYDAPGGEPELNKLWSAKTKDASSNRTGSSVFDFDGDGRSEVIYNDEWYLRIYPGVEPDCQLAVPGPGCDGDMTDAELLFIDINSSGTRVEYPVIADVDGDFKAELVVVTNNSTPQGNIGDAGVEVWDDRFDNWVGTLPIWNQHSYHVTNVDARGQIPLVEPDNWLVPAAKPYNSYRRNTQGAVENCAPDLVAEDLELVGQCSGDLSLSARVCNRGCLGVGPGVAVSFTATGIGMWGTTQTTTAIPAGGCVRVGLTVVDPGPAPYEVSVFVDDDGKGGGLFNECVEDNNRFGPKVLCPRIG